MIYCKTGLIMGLWRGIVKAGGRLILCLLYWGHGS